MHNAHSVPLFRVGRFPRLLWTAVCVYFAALAVQALGAYYQHFDFTWNVSENPLAVHCLVKAGEVLWFLIGAGLGLVRRLPLLFVLHVMASALYIIWLSRLLPA